MWVDKYVGKFLLGKLLGRHKKIKINVMPIIYVSEKLKLCLNICNVMSILGVDKGIHSQTLLLYMNCHKYLPFLRKEFP